MTKPSGMADDRAGGQVGFTVRDRRAWFAYLGSKMGGHGETRARDLTLALHASIGA
jgi:hypothetical protein